MTVLSVFDLVLRVLRPAVFVAAVVLGVFSLVDWLVRTRRIGPFTAVSRFSRAVMDPLLKPVEQSVVRAGGNPQVAPFWALALAVVGGIVGLSILQFVRDQLYIGFAASQSGPRGIGLLLLGWTFQVVRVALMVRVLCSWVRISPYSRWVRWAFVLTEPILGPLRRVVPTLGMVDITPIVAWFLLSLVERVVMGGLQ